MSRPLGAGADHLAGDGSRDVRLDRAPVGAVVEPSVVEPGDAHVFVEGHELVGRRRRGCGRAGEGRRSGAREGQQGDGGERRALHR